MSKIDHRKTENSSDHADSPNREHGEVLETRRRFVRKALVSAGLLAGAGVVTKGLLGRPAFAGTTTPPPSVDEPSTLMLLAGGAAAVAIANRVHDSKSRRHEDENSDEDED